MKCRGGSDYLYGGGGQWQRQMRKAFLEDEMSEF